MDLASIEIPALSGLDALRSERAPKDVPQMACAIVGGRLTVGAGSAELRTYISQRTSQLTPSAGGIHLIIPTAGQVTAIDGHKSFQAERGEALLLAQPGRIHCVWSAGSASVIVHLRRARIQAEASRVLEAPRRLAAVCAVIPCRRGDPLATAAADLIGYLSGSVHRSARGERLEQAIIVALIDAIQKRRGSVEILSVAGSLNRVVQYLRAHPNRAHTADELAAVSGVTIAVLRRNFKSCFGVPLSAFVRDVRLDWVHERLSSQAESRSIQQLASEAGFTLGLLARAYQRRFMETPSRTRARAFATQRT
jgi:AraC-like DNA-binding protein